MKNKGYYYCMLLIIFLTSNTILMGQTTTYSGNGKWNSAGNWTSGLPDSTISATIPSRTAVNVLSNVSCFDLTVDLGTLTIASGGVLNVYGNFTNTGSFSIDPGGQASFRNTISNSFGRQHIEINGSIEIAGSIEVDETFGKVQ